MFLPVRPGVVVFVDVVWANDHDVDVAVVVGFASSERTEDDHARGWEGKFAGCIPHAFECRVA